MITLEPDVDKTTFYLKKGQEYKIIGAELIQLVTKSEQRVSAVPITKRARGTVITQNVSLEISPDISTVYITPTENIELEMQKRV